MRKFGCLLLAVLIFVFGLMPVSASANVFNTTSDNRTATSPLLFNTIRNSDGVDFPWVLNSCEIGVDNQRIVVDPGYAVDVYSRPFDSDLGGSSVSLTLYTGAGAGLVGSGSSFSLVNSGSQFVSWSRLGSWRLSNEFQGVRIVSVDISFDYIYPEYDEFWNEYIGKTAEIEYSYYAVGDGDGGFTCYIGDWIKEMITRQFGGEPSVYACINDLLITFHYIRESDDLPAFDIRYVGSDAIQPQAVKWLDSFDLSYDPVDGGSTFDWLIDAVEGFLDFEIAPGLSINKILYIVLVIGVLLWFITLLI